MPIMFGQSAILRLRQTRRPHRNLPLSHPFPSRRGASLKRSRQILRPHLSLQRVLCQNKLAHPSPKPPSQFNAKPNASPLPAPTPLPSSVTRAVGVPVSLISGSVGLPLSLNNQKSYRRASWRFSMSQFFLPFASISGQSGPDAPPKAPFASAATSSPDCSWLPCVRTNLPDSGQRIQSSLAPRGLVSRRKISSSRIPSQFISPLL